jgi:hypothetical protein
MTMIVMTMILTRLMTKSSRVGYVHVNPLVHENSIHPCKSVII